MINNNMQRLLLIRPAFIFRLIRFSLGTSAAASLLLCALPVQAVQVGVSVTGEVAPGVYGRVDVGNVAPPVFYPQPLIITRQPNYVPVAPIYLNVPPGHARNWARYCGRYQACYRPVYFVRTREYDAYPAYQPRGYRAEEHRDYHDHDGAPDGGRGNQGAYPGNDGSERGGEHGRGHGHGHH